jgi:hypothetical protein
MQSPNVKPEHAMKKQRSGFFFLTGGRQFAFHCDNYKTMTQLAVIWLNPIAAV